MQEPIKPIEQIIKNQIAENPIILYMKGTPRQPHCGFSAQAVKCLSECGVEFATVNVLENPEIRSVLPKIANWPTFPQLWVKGELIGGCDIMTEMHANGELLPLVQSASAG